MADTTKKKEYVPSSAVTQAQAAWQAQQANKPGAYQSQWDQTMNDTINKILNREDFSYDLNGDALYQQYKNQAIQQGQQAAMDTMGQAAALTGGYGNSYAQTVGQQTYQGYLQGLNDKIPELYNLALSKYQMEGDQLMNQYGIVSDRENTEYGRYRDQTSDYYTELGILGDQYYNERSFDYGQHRDAVSDSQWQTEFDEAQRRYNQEWEASQAKTSGGGSGGGGGGGDDEEEEEATASASEVISTLKSDFPSGVVTDSRSWSRALQMLRGLGYDQAGAISVLKNAGFSVNIATTQGVNKVGSQKYVIN